MKLRTTIQQELESLNSSLPFDLKEPVFTVPDRYFEDFAERMLTIVRNTEAKKTDSELHELAPTLAGLSRKMPLAVPENYFESFAQDVPVLMRSNNVLPSILLEGSREVPYSVPDGYFENFAGNVLQRVQAAPVVTTQPAHTAPVVPMFAQWRKLAVAASIADAVVAGGIFYWNGQKPSPGAASNETVLQDVSTKDLDQFIQSTDAVYNGTHTVANNVSAQKLLKDVSKEDLDAFLREVPEGHDL